jgi:hypothetical protein
VEFILSNALRTVNGKSVPFAQFGKRPAQSKPYVIPDPAYPPSTHLYLYLKKHVNLGSGFKILANNLQGMY